MSDRCIILCSSFKGCSQDSSWINRQNQQQWYMKHSLSLFILTEAAHCLQLDSFLQSHHDTLFPYDSNLLLVWFLFVYCFEVVCMLVCIQQMKEFILQRFDDLAWKDVSHWMLNDYDVRLFLCGGDFLLYHSFVMPFSSFSSVIHLICQRNANRTIWCFWDTNAHEKNAFCLKVFLLLLLQEYSVECCFIWEFQRDSSESYSRSFALKDSFMVSYLARCIQEVHFLSQNCCNHLFHQADSPESSF